jgi:hypothetical protein
MAWFAVGVKKAQSGLDDFLPEVKCFSYMFILKGHSQPCGLKRGNPIAKTF